MLSGSLTPDELVYANGNQAVGIRFDSLDIPPGSTIESAYVQFQVDEVGSGVISLTIEGEDTGNAPSFTTTTFNISSRSRTSASVIWDPEPWTSPGQAGATQQTSDISSVIQEIIDNPGWSKGNALALIFTGTGKRVAESFNTARAVVKTAIKVVGDTSQTLARCASSTSFG